MPRRISYRLHCLHLSFSIPHFLNSFPKNPFLSSSFTDEDGIRASELEGEFAEMDGWEAESNAAQLLNGLGIDDFEALAEKREINSCNSLIFSSFFLFASFICLTRSWLDSYQKS